MRNKDLNLAYISGLFDMGGCVRIETPKTGSRSSLYVWITAKEFKLVEQLQIMAGAIIGPKSDGQWRAKWRDKRALNLLQNILPHLKSQKRIEEVNIGIEFMKSRLEKPDDNQDVIFKLRLRLTKAAK
jgi:hypothetical protein